MRLYLARHGEAGRAASDELRQLTGSGRADSERVFRLCRERVDRPLARVISSPLIRAQQTADLALAILPLATDAVIISDHLRPQSSVVDIIGLLDSDDSWPLLLVGHQPVLGELLSWCCGEDRLRYVVATSSLFALDLFANGRDCASLAWAAYP